MTLMSAITAVPAVPAFAFQPGNAPGLGRRAWDVAMARYVTFTQAAERETLYVHRLDDARERLVAKIPHVDVKHACGWYVMSTSNELHVRQARGHRRDVCYIEECAFEDHKQMVALADAADARDAKLARIDRRLGWQEANDRHDAAWDKSGLAWRQLLDTPAPDGEALMWKIEQLYAPGDNWGKGVEDQTRADLRRLLLRTN